jgi:hypothetical protein
MRVGRRIEISIDELYCWIDTLGRKNAAGQRIEETFGYFPADRLRYQRRIDRLGRTPDRACPQSRTHQCFHPIR